MDELAYKISNIINMCGGEYIWQFVAVALIFLPCRKRRLWGVRYICGLACIVLPAVFVPIPFTDRWAVVYYAVYFVLFAAFNALVYKYKPVQVLFISLCMYCLQYLISCLSYAAIFTVVGLKGDYGVYWIYYYIMPLIIVLVDVMAYFIVVRRIKRAGDIQFNNSFIIFIACAFVIAASFLTYWVRVTLWYPYSLAALMGIGVLLAIIVLITLFMNIKAVWLSQENIVLTKMLEKDKAHYEQLKISNEKIQIKYHDMKKLQKDGIMDFEGLSGIKEAHEVLVNTYYTGNTALDIVLSEKSMMCDRLGIDFVCTADGSAVGFMKPHHIYSLMVNAIENCIESVRRREDHREIEVVVVRKDDMCVIKTVNYTDAEKLEFKDGVPATTNANKEEHGFGVKSMKEIVTRYGGDINFSIDNHYFTLVAIIPVPSSYAKDGPRKQ